MKEEKTIEEPKKIYKSYVTPILYTNLDVNDYVKLKDNKEITIYSNIPGHEGLVMMRLTGEIQDEKETKEAK